MSGIEVGTAFVRILPDTTAFNAALATQINAATAAAGVGSANKRVAASATAAAASTQAMRKGFLQSEQAANALRGAIIGLSRVTPVTVFGLTLWGTAAIAAGLAIKSAVKSAAEFESQLNTFQAVTQATDEEMQQVSATALALGADLTLPATSANDAADALTELSKAGLSVQDSLAAAKGVLQLATAASISAGDAAKIAATQLNAFNLTGDQAVRVAELLADASIASQGEITDFAAGMQQAGAAAAQSGLSFEQTTGLLTQLGLAGLKGADGGTGLRTALLRLVPTTKEAIQYVEALGINLDKTKSVGEKLPDIIEQYRTQLQLLTTQQQTLVLNQILGQDAFRVGSVIFTQHKDALKDLLVEFEKTNALEDLSKAKAEGLSGAVGSLKSQFETFGTQVGLLASGPLESFVRGTSHTFDNIGKVAGALSDLDKQHDIVKNVAVLFKMDFVGDVPSFLVPGSGKGQSLNDLLKSGAKYLFAPTLFNKIVDEALPDQKEILGPSVPKGFFDKPIGRRNFQIPTEAEIAFNSVEGRRRRAIVAKQAADSAAADEAKKGIPIPKGLQQAQVDAQINNSLSAELAADNAILMFLEHKRDRLKEGTKAFLSASKQVEGAQAQRDSVQAEIEGVSDKQKSDRDRARREREQEARKDKAARDLVRRTILEIDQQTFSNVVARASLTTVSSADAIRVRENRIKKLEAERQNAIDVRKKAKQGSQAQLDAILQVKKLNADILGLQSSIAEVAKTEVDRRKSLLELRVDQAALTPGTTDDEKRLQNEIDYIRTLQKQTKKLSQEWIDYESQITSLKSRIEGLRGSGGFSLNDLFQEAISQFNEFSSNVSSSVTTSGGVRGALGGAIASQNPNLTRADHLKLAKAEDTNDLLRDIRDAVVGRDGPLLLAGARDPVGPAGFATGAHARRFSKVRGK